MKRRSAAISIELAWSPAAGGCSGARRPPEHGRNGSCRERRSGWLAMSRKPRVPSPEEELLWQLVAEGAKPLDKERARKVPQAPLKKRPGPDAREPFEIPDFRVGEKSAHSLAAMPGVSQPTLRMDQKKFARMKRGKTAPDARIDLHGKTVADGRGRTCFVSAQCA